MLKTLSLAVAAVLGLGMVASDSEFGHGKMMSVELHENWGGAAYCGSKPTSWVRSDMIADWDGSVLTLKPEGLKLLVHEMEHERTVRANARSCDEYRLWIQQEGNELANEARSYCVAARYEAREGIRPFHIAADEAATMIVYNYGMGVSRRQARAAIEAACEH